MKKKNKVLPGMLAVLGLAMLTNLATIERADAAFWNDIMGKKEAKQGNGSGQGVGRGVGGKQGKVGKQEDREEKRDAVKEAIESNSYEAFQAATDGTPLAETINTEEKFNQLVESNNLAKAGSLEEAKAIKEELGIKDSPRQQERQRRDAMNEIIESGDFSMFQELNQGKPIAEIINTEEEFAKFIEARGLVKTGNYDEARAIYVELGLNAPEQFREEKKTEMKKILESSDYDAFVEVVAGKPIAEIVNTEEKFQQLVEAHNLMTQGDREGASAILESLGL